MRLASSFLTVLAVLLGPSPLQAGEAPRRLCPEDVPEGVRLPARPGCPAARAARPRGDDGSYEIGGVTLRVGGRVGVDTSLRR